MVSHFQRKYRLDFEPEEALAFVLGEAGAGESVGEGVGEKEIETGEQERGGS